LIKDGAAGDGAAGGNTTAAPVTTIILQSFYTRSSNKYDIHDLIPAVAAVILSSSSVSV
jgi:hypothetical protein